MAPVAKNCDTEVRIFQRRPRAGGVHTEVRAKALLPDRWEHVIVEIDTEKRTVIVQYVEHRLSECYQHEKLWSSAFPHEPTLGEMIEAAESLARGEWFKLFPET